MKAFDFGEVKHYRFAVMMKPFFKVISFIFFRVKVIGRENVPEEGGFIAASNHVSGVDPMFVYVNLKIPVHYMSKKELFEKSLLNWFYTHLNGFPVKRDTPDKRAIEYAIKVVEQGSALGIFPEGTRSKDYTPQQAKPGVALIARKAKSSVLPVSIYSAGRAKPFKKITVRFGKIIPFESLGFGSGVKSDELEAASNRIMDEIRALWALKHSNQND